LSITDITTDNSIIINRVDSGDVGSAVSHPHLELLFDYCEHLVTGVARHAVQFDVDIHHLNGDSERYPDGIQGF
jgi:hypothetical protein